MNSRPKYIKRFAYVNNDSIKDIIIMEGQKIDEIWYGVKRSEKSRPIYMTKEDIYHRINFGEKWNLEPKKDTILENFVKKTGIY